jgi:fermentation-respiration switch protein FrsA (DUF1100 family)
MLKAAVVVLAALVAALLLFVWAYQRFGIYRFETEVRQPAEFGLSNVRVASFRSEDGAQVSAWIAAPRGDEPVLLAFGGNFAGAGGSAARLQPLLDRGFGMALLVYRGSSGDRGTPSEEAFAMDARALYDALDGLIGRTIPPQRRVLHGFSLGTSVAAGLAAQRPAAGLVLEASFDRCCRWYTRRLRGLPMCALMWRERHDVIDKLAGVAVAKLFLHGSQDDAIPVAWGRALYDACEGEKRFVVIEGGGHADLAEHGALDEVAAFAAASANGGR